MSPATSPAMMIGASRALSRTERLPFLSRGDALSEPLSRSLEKMVWPDCAAWAFRRSSGAGKRVASSSRLPGSRSTSSRSFPPAAHTATRPASAPRIVLHASSIACAASEKARFSSTARAAVSSAATSSLRPLVFPCRVCDLLTGPSSNRDGQLRPTLIRASAAVRALRVALGWWLLWDQNTTPRRRAGR